MTKKAIKILLAVTVMIATFVVITVVASGEQLIEREGRPTVLVTDNYVYADHSDCFCEGGEKQSYRVIYFQYIEGYCVQFEDLYFPELYGFSSDTAYIYDSDLDCSSSTDYTSFSAGYLNESEDLSGLGVGTYTLGFTNPTSSDPYKYQFYFQFHLVDDPSDYVSSGSGSGTIPEQGGNVGTSSFLFYNGVTVSFNTAEKYVVNYSDLGKSNNVPFVRAVGGKGFLNHFLGQLYGSHLTDVLGHSSGNCSPVDVYVSTFYEGGVLKTSQYSYSTLIGDPGAALFSSHGLYLVTIVSDVTTCDSDCSSCSDRAYFSFYVFCDMTSFDLSFTVTDKLTDSYQEGYEAGSASSGTGSSVNVNSGSGRDEHPWIYDPTDLREFDVGEWCEIQNIKVPTFYVISDVDYFYFIEEACAYVGNTHTGTPFKSFSSGSWYTYQLLYFDTSYNGYLSKGYYDPSNGVSFPKGEYIVEFRIACDCSGCDGYDYEYLFFYVVADEVLSEDPSKYYAAYDRGYSEGYRNGYREGDYYTESLINKNRAEAYKEGLDDGYDNGYLKGFEDCAAKKSFWYDDGYSHGYATGYDQGVFDSSVSSEYEYMEGYTAGYSDGIGVTMQNGGNPVSGFFSGIASGTIKTFQYVVTNIHISNGSDFSVSLLQAIEWLLFFAVAIFVVKLIIKGVLKIL